MDLAWQASVQPAVTASSCCLMGKTQGRSLDIPFVEEWGITCTDSTDKICNGGALSVLLPPQLLLLAAVSLIAGAITAPAADWTEFTRYFKESRLVSSLQDSDFHLR